MHALEWTLDMSFICTKEEKIVPSMNWRISFQTPRKIAKLLKKCTFLVDSERDTLEFTKVHREEVKNPLFVQKLDRYLNLLGSFWPSFEILETLFEFSLVPPIIFGHYPLPPSENVYVKMYDTGLKPMIKKL